MYRPLVLLGALALLGACDGNPSPDAGLDGGQDAAQSDAGPDDAGPDDAGPGDAGPDDAGPDDGAVTDAGGGPIGSIEGMCGVLDTELTSSMPFFFENTASFPDGWALAMADALSPGAQEILRDGTAGGSSSYSEAFAFEVLHRCEGASLLKSETEIVYQVAMPGSITDMLVEIGTERIGVSVTRAVTVTGACMRADTFTPTAARDLLTRKLSGVNESSMLVSAADAWTKQILFIFADTTTHAMALMEAWAALDASLRADTILYVSVSDAMDAFIYFEDRC